MAGEGLRSPQDIVQLNFEAPGFMPSLGDPAVTPGEVDPRLLQAIEELGFGIGVAFSPGGGIDPAIAEAFARLGSGPEFLAFGREYLDSRGITNEGLPHISYGRGR